MTTTYFYIDIKPSYLDVVKTQHIKKESTTFFFGSKDTDHAFEINIEDLVQVAKICEIKIPKLLNIYSVLMDCENGKLHSKRTKAALKNIIWMNITVLDELELLLMKAFEIHYHFTESDSTYGYFYDSGGTEDRMHLIKEIKTHDENPMFFTKSESPSVITPDGLQFSTDVYDLFDGNYY